MDEALFPPPPPSRGPLAGRGGDLTGPADGGAHKDLEREAFNAELDRLAAALDQVTGHWSAQLLGSLRCRSFSASYSVLAVQYT